MATSSIPKRKRRDPTSTPPRSPVAVDTIFANNGGVDFPSFPCPKSPHTLMANRLSNLSIQGAFIPETPEQSPIRRIRFLEERKGSSDGEGSSPLAMDAAENKVLDQEVEYVEYAPNADEDEDAMDITPPEEPRYAHQPSQSDHQLSFTTTTALTNPEHQPNEHPHKPPSRTVPRHPHHHHRKRSSHSIIRKSPPHRPMSPGLRTKHSSINPIAAIQRSLSPIPAIFATMPKRPPSPLPSFAATTTNTNDTMADVVDPPTLQMLDPDDDGYGINGIGYKPTPQMAHARAQKRKQQVLEWRAREAREARQRRIERRGVGLGRGSEMQGEGMDEAMDGRRIVRFA